MTAVSHFAASMTSLILAVSLSFGHVAWAASASGEPVRVEVFTAQDLTIQEVRRGDVALAPMMIEVYALDGIARLEAILSKQLPADPKAARRAALTRVSRVDAVWIEEVQQAAVGLFKAAEYGIDRYPAIVFDGQAVVYGVIDVEQALYRYRQWQEVSGQ